MSRDRLASEEFYINKSPRINWRGAMLIKNGTRTVLSRDEPVVRKDLLGNPLEIYLPREWRTFEQRKRLRIMEGYQVLGAVRNTPQILKEIGGYGAPIILQEPYNSEYSGKLIIAKEIVNTGIIKEAYNNDNHTGIEFWLNYQKGSGHQIIIWQPPDDYIVIQSEDIDEDKGVIPTNQWKIPFAISEETALFVAYRGVWLGSWYGKNFFEVLEKNFGQIKKPMIVAAILRWGNLPVLCQGLVAFVWDLVKKFTEEVVSTWLYMKSMYVPTAKKE